MNFSVAIDRAVTLDADKMITLLLLVAAVILLILLFIVENRNDPTLPPRKLSIPIIGKSANKPG